MRLASKAYDVPDVWTAQELYHANGWTDGLPIVPPTRDAVVACLEMAVADPVQLVGVEPVRGVAVTAEKLAINAVMAGCLPKSCLGVSATLTTTAFARSSLRWLEIGS